MSCLESPSFFSRLSFFFKMYYWLVLIPLISLYDSEAVPIPGQQVAMEDSLMGRDTPLIYRRRRSRRRGKRRRRRKEEEERRNLFKRSFAGKFPSCVALIKNIGIHGTFM